MAYFQVDPNLFTPAAITAQQTSPGTDPWLVTPEFASWIDNNQPTSFMIANGGCWIDLPDWNPSVILDYMAKWVPGS